MAAIGFQTSSRAEIGDFARSNRLHKCTFENLQGVLRSHVEIPGDREDVFVRYLDSIKDKFENGDFTTKGHFVGLLLPICGSAEAIATLSASESGFMSTWSALSEEICPELATSPSMGMLSDDEECQRDEGEGAVEVDPSQGGVDEAAKFAPDVNLTSNQESRFKNLVSKMKEFQNYEFVLVEDLPKVPRGSYCVVGKVQCLQQKPQELTKTKTGGTFYKTMYVLVGEFSGEVDVVHLGSRDHVMSALGKAGEVKDQIVAVANFIVEKSYGSDDVHIEMADNFLLKRLPDPDGVFARRQLVAAPFQSVGRLPHNSRVNVEGKIIFLYARQDFTVVTLVGACGYQIDIAVFGEMRSNQVWEKNSFVLICRGRTSLKRKNVICNDSSAVATPEAALRAKIGTRSHGLQVQWNEFIGSEAEEKMSPSPKKPKRGN